MAPSDDTWTDRSSSSGINWTFTVCFCVERRGLQLLPVSNANFLITLRAVVLSPARIAYIMTWNQHQLDVAILSFLAIPGVVQIPQGTGLCARKSTFAPTCDKIYLPRLSTSFIRNDRQIISEIKQQKLKIHSTSILLYIHNASLYLYRPQILPEKWLLFLYATQIDH